MRRLIIDTGSNVSILQPGISGSDVMVTNMKPYGVTGQELDIKGRQAVTFEFGCREFRHTFLVCSLPTDAAGLLVTDFMEDTGPVINLERGKMSLTDVTATPRASVEPSNRPAVLTVFHGVKRDTALSQIGERRIEPTGRCKPVQLVRWLGSSRVHASLSNCRQGIALSLPIRVTVCALGYVLRASDQRARAPPPPAHSLERTKTCM
jgi:hypothetical protein